MVLTTGNKSELGVGYCTLYGDMCGGLAVISDVPKTLVYRLAHYVNSQWLSAFRSRPSRSRRRPSCVPTRRTATRFRRTRYWTPSWSTTWRTITRRSRLPTEHGYDPQLVRKVARMVDRSEYKRQQAAPGLKISEKAFGFGRRYPIAAKLDV